MNLEVAKYLEQLQRWQAEITYLREIILECGLEETCKWRQPCYTYKGKNVVLLYDLKDHCGIAFMKGALLNDKESILIQPTKNVQAGRQMRFTDIGGIAQLEASIKAYILEAIEVEKSGQEVENKKTEDFEVPEELEQKFAEDTALKAAFEQLTEGRKRGYLLHFSQAKQSQTREARILKNRAKIIAGKGLYDCSCGLSKRMPICDGSHKFIGT